MAQDFPQPIPPPDGGADRTDYRRGLLALRAGQLEDAILSLTRAMQICPEDAAIRRNLSRAFLAAGRFTEAQAEAARLLEATPDDAELWFILGTALTNRGEPAQACRAFSRAIALRDDHAPAWLNCGNAAMDLDDVTSAEAMYRAAIRLDPSLAEAHASLGYALTRRGALDEAMQACEAAIRLRPVFARAQMNLATAALLNGDLSRGFAAYESRKHVDAWRRDFPPPGLPLWDASDPNGLAILVLAEQGHGDVIQAARYLVLLRNRGARVSLACQAALVPLLRQLPGIRVLSPGDAVPRCDVHADIMSLPHLFGTVLDSIPLSCGYLTADPLKVDVWKRRLPRCRKIGVVFAGNRQHPGDARRSIPPSTAHRLLHEATLHVAADAMPPDGAPGWVNLHVGAGDAGLGLADFSTWLTDYSQTAALIENLDLVIAVDTSVAHLAGAMGKPVWILLPAAPDWRWMLGRADSPWYASARLFRQSRAGDWGPVLQQVALALSGWSQMNAPLTEHLKPAAEIIRSSTSPH